MKVTVLSSLPPQRGVTPYTVQLLAALSARSDIDVEALGFRSLYPRRQYPGGAPDAGDDVALAVPAERWLTWYNPLTWTRAGLSVRGDVIHAQWWSWFLAPSYVVVLALARLRGKRVVVTVHNAEPHEGGRWRSWLNALVVRQAHAVIVHTQANVAHLAEAGVDPARVSVVPHGLLGGGAKGRVTREEARGALGLPLEGQIALAFGNIRPYKGMDILMRALAAARPALPRLRLIVAGELWKGCLEPSELARRCGVEHAVIRQAGYVPDHHVTALFAAADVVVFPYTHFDGQSGAATLALSAGRAMLVTDVGGLPELVRDPRAIVPAGDVDALARALIDVLGDAEWRRRLETDAAVVRAALSWNAIASATVRVYEQAIGATATATPKPARQADGDVEAA